MDTNILRFRTDYHPHMAQVQRMVEEVLAKGTPDEKVAVHQELLKAQLRLQLFMMCRGSGFDPREFLIIPALETPT